MNDMTSVIAPKSDQLNSDDLIAGPRTIRIREVAIRPGTEQPVSIFFEGDNGKPWKPCKSASRVLVAAWGADANVYVGRAATLYRDDAVTWGGMKVGGIRVSHLSNIDKPLVLALTEKKGSKKVATIHPLKADTPSTDDPAAKFARSVIAKVGTLEMLDALASYEADRGDKLADLRGKRPELAEQVTDAIQARYAELEKALPAKDDADMGEREDA